jgi:hypothetical protein
MKTISLGKRKSLYMKVFKSKEFDCIIIVYLDEDNNVISFNYHWGTDDIQTQYLQFNDNSIETKLYKVLFGLNGKKHSPKLYDQVIAAHSVYHPIEFKLSQVETELAEQKLINKTLKSAIKSVVDAE